MVPPILRKCVRQLHLILLVVVGVTVLMYGYPNTLLMDTTDKNTFQGLESKVETFNRLFLDREVERKQKYSGNSAVLGNDGFDSGRVNNVNHRHYSKDAHDVLKNDSPQDGYKINEDVDTSGTTTSRELFYRNDQPTNKKKQKLIIMTYMRSGSSFIGDLFQQHQDVFYVFEPLWGLQKFHNNHTHFIQYLNGTLWSKKFLKPEFWSKNNSMSTEIIDKVLDCRFQELDIVTLRAPHMKSSKRTDIYMKCIKSLPLVKSIEAIKYCLQLLQRPCSNAKVTVVKTIRYTAEQLEQLLASDPDVKVIHLFRDPRGSLLSQYRVGDYQWNQRQQAFQRLCNRILTDLKHSHRLSKRFPKRILNVRYEDVVRYPVAAVKFMYNFVGLKLTERIQNYIWNITYSHEPKDKKCGALCTVRRNATDTAYKWRKMIRFSTIHLIDTHCSPVENVLGYRQFTSMYQYKTLTYSSISDEFGKSLNYSTFMTRKQLESMPESNLFPPFSQRKEI